MSTFKTQIISDCIVEYRYIPFKRGIQNSLHVPEEPDQEEDVEIISVKTSNGNEIEISNTEALNLVDNILESLHE